MTKRDLLDRLDALRTVAETLPEDAAVDCAMAFKPDYSGTTGSIALTQNLNRLRGPYLSLFLCGRREGGYVWGQIKLPRRVGGPAGGW